MPFTMPNYPILSYEQANPFFGGMKYGAGIGQDFANVLAKQLENQKARELMPFVTPMAEQDLQKARLANIYQGLVNQYTPEDYKSTFALRGAQTGLASAQKDKIKYMLEHPGYMAGDEAKLIQYLSDLGALDKSKLNASQNNTQQPSLQTGQQMEQQGGSQTATPFQTGNPLVDAILNRKFAQSAYQQQMLQGYNWSHLPADTKNQLVAQGLGMGVDPLKMMKYINEGKNLQQIATAEGLDPENLPAPIYAPTTATKTRVQQVEQVGNELDYLSSATTPLIKEYANTFAGYSPDRIRDMMSGDPDAQKRFGRYIGALSLQTGLANGRVLLEGGRAGLEVMRMVKDSALKGIDQHSPIKMSSVAYEEAQKTIDSILQKGAKIRTTTGMNPFSEIGKSKTKSENITTNKENNKGVIKYVRDSSGKLVRSS